MERWETGVKTKANRSFFAVGKVGSEMTKIVRRREDMVKIEISSPSSPKPLATFR